MRRAREGAQVGNPDWYYWTNLADVELSGAVALSCGIDPNHLDLRPQYVQAQSGDHDPYRTRLRIAESHVAAGTLPHEKRRNYYDKDACFVKLGVFRTWGELLPQPFTFPNEFPKAMQTVERVARVAGHWPWGNHETELLRKLAAAADKFWKLYDPSDATTAPTNDAVVAWLTGQGVAERNAQVMATILRADKLRTGPRK